MPTISEPHFKAGQSIDRKIMDIAKNSPVEMIQYLESLPDGFFDHDDPGNLLSHLYQTALKSRAKKQRARTFTSKI